MIPLADPLILLFISAYLFLTPFTKVEESFNTQAVHDILHYGLDLSRYDHIEFPGPVPRSFIGALFISAISKPVLYFLPKTISKLDGQLITRGLLGTVNAFLIVYVKNKAFKAVKKASANPLETHKKGKKVTKASVPYNAWSFGLWFTLFQISQFHIPFYASRFLPNYLALPLTNYAFGQLFLENYATAITTLSFAAIVLRIELVALVFALSIALILYNKISTTQIIKAGLKGAVFGAVLSGVVDSLFWGRLTIPELESFVFNVIDGKSAEWGTEPYYAYFTKYLLAIFMPPHVLVLAILGYFADPTRSLLKISAVTSLTYIMIMSLQPHKELRFIIYTGPIFTLLGANGAATLTSKFGKSFFCKLAVFTTLFLTLVSMAISVVWGEVTSFNYPGGYAFLRFHEMVVMRKMRDELPEGPVVVHIDTSACMTGVTHFGEFSDLMGIETIYNKNENPTMEQWQTFNFLITDVGPKDNTGHAIPYMEGWSWARRASIGGYVGLDLRAFGRLNFENIYGNVIRMKSLMPVVDAIKMFIRQEELLHIYEKVQGEVQPPVAQPSQKPRRTRKKASSVATE